MTTYASAEGSGGYGFGCNHYETTGGGFSNSYDFNRPKASGATTPMEFSSPFFAWGGILKSAFGGLVGLFSESAVISSVGSGSQYSVAFEMKLASTSYPGVYRGAHFLEANKALSTAIGADAGFASSISNLGINLPKSAAGSLLGKSPANWVWHHDIGTGVMQLVPKAQHTIGSSFWNTLHPGGAGGFSMWGK